MRPEDSMILELPRLLSSPDWNSGRLRRRPALLQKSYWSYLPYSLVSGAS